MDLNQPGKELRLQEVRLRQSFAGNDDFVVHDFVISDAKVPARLLFLRGAAEARIITHILKSMSAVKDLPSPDINRFDWLKNQLELTDVNRATDSQVVADGILSGDITLIVDGFTDFVRIPSNGFEYRGISEPVTEGVVKGPREGFNESIQTNLSLIRRRLRSTRLKTDVYMIGRTTKTEVRVVFLEGTAPEALLEEVRKRLEAIEVESILESQYIEEYIEDSHFSIFPQVESTERPDRVTAAILSGRAAIFVDGTPFVMIVPVTLSNFLISSEDYYQRYPFTFFIRLLRYVAAGFSLLLPAFYISVMTFHQEMVPTPLMISIVHSYEKVPFPVLVEALMLELTFEVLREAGIRLPRPIGQAVSIVGALVIGQAAVQAGLVSYGMVIVVSLTGIMSFVIPAYNLAISFRMLRFVFMLVGATLGLYGVLLGMIALLIHLASLRSFGVPFLSPVAPVQLSAWKDTILRVPWWNLSRRTAFNGKHKKR